MHATFAQLLKAYSAFNNDGKAMTPRIVDYFENEQGRHYRLDPPQPDRQAVSQKTAEQIHKILIDVVKRGTGVAGQYTGLEIGGKTGTAHIATSAGYSRLYHSSFYGFANDKSGRKYTIGVLVIKAKKPYKYFASKSAVPTFKKITNALVELDYLKPVLSPKELAEKEKREAEIARKEAAKEARETARYQSEMIKKVEKPVQKPKPRISKPAVRKKRSPSTQELFNDLDMF
jgi:cell division protein FtsI (penicillin-binding protein 3)